MQLMPPSLKAFAEGVQDKSHARASNSGPPPPDARDDLPKENPCQVACGKQGEPDPGGSGIKGSASRPMVTRLDLLAELRPVVEEFLEADVRERVLHELLEHRKRQRDHVRARLRRVHHVERVAD